MLFLNLQRKTRRNQSQKKLKTERNIFNLSQRIIFFKSNRITNQFLKINNSPIKWPNALTRPQIMTDTWLLKLKFTELLFFCLRSKILGAKLTILEPTIQGHLVHLQSRATTTLLHSRTFPFPPKGTPSPLAVSPHPPPTPDCQTPAAANLFSVSGFSHSGHFI